MRTHVLGEERARRVVQLLYKTLADSVARRQSLAKTFAENVAKRHSLAEPQRVHPPVLSVALANHFEEFHSRRADGESELIETLKTLLAQSEAAAPRPLAELLSKGTALSPLLHAALARQFEQEQGAAADGRLGAARVAEDNRRRGSQHEAHGRYGSACAQRGRPRSVPAGYGLCSDVGG